MTNMASGSGEDPKAGPTSARIRAVTPPGLVLVGASTGGPQALIALMSGLTPIIGRLPVCVTLHMPPDLMPVIAAHVARLCQIETSVVTESRRLDVGVVHFAPGDRHMRFRRTSDGMEIVLVPSMPGEFCKPAIDVMFASGAASHGARSLGIVLSGMGKDGLAGARAIVAAGGSILVQDKASSAVWGMPGAVANANLASAILSPALIAKHVVDRLPVLARAL